MEKDIRIESGRFIFSNLFYIQSLKSFENVVKHAVCRKSDQFLKMEQKNHPGW